MQIPFFSAKQDAPLTVDGVLADLSEKIAQLEQVSAFASSEAARLEEESKRLKEEAQRSKVEANRAANVMTKIQALIS